VATSFAKPMLTEENKTKRVAFSVNHVDPTTHFFIDMEDIVHIDENCST
jgi:hypothetical protein